ncbi:MAG: tetratricopeptide repeat protein [Bacteroidetes bacterium]|nr:tetratricopeptide repeat protein [Bacteroidota bacterium]
MIIKISLFVLIFIFTGNAQVKNDTNNLYLLGQSYMRGAQYKDAKDIFEKIYNQYPDNYQYFNSLNQAYLQLKMYKESVDLINKKLQKAQNDINLYGLLGASYYLSGDENKAFSVWDETLKKLKPNYANYRIIANHAIERRAFEKAIEYLQAGKKAANDPKFFSFDLANLYTLTMQFENAAKEYCIILANNPKQLRIVESKILNYIGKPNALNTTIKVVKNWSENRNINFSFLLAKLYRENNEDVKAFDVFLKIEKEQNSNGRQLITFANGLLTENKYSLASKVYNKIISDYKNSRYISSAKLGYTKSLGAELWEIIKKAGTTWKPYYKIKNNYPEKTEEVIAAYKQLIINYKLSEVGAEAFLRIGEINLKIKKNLVEAISNFSNIIKNYPTSRFIPEAFNLRGQAFIENGEMEKAFSNFNFMTKDRRISLSMKNAAKFQLAKINFYRGNFEKAVNLLDQIIKNKNDNSSNDALELSLLLNTTKSDSVHLLKFARVDLLITQNNFDSAYSLLKKIYTDKSTFFVLKSIAKFRFAQIEIALDSLPNSLITLSEIIKDKKRNIFADKALFLKSKIYQFGLNDNNEAVKMYQMLLTNFPNSIYVDKARKEIIKLKNK